MFFKKHFRQIAQLSSDLSRENFRSKLILTLDKNGHAHTLSSFLVDTYVTILIKEFRRVLRHFCNLNNIKSSEDFSAKYLDFSVDEIREIMALPDAKLLEVDKVLGQSLKYSILDSYEVQRMDGKGAFIIRKLIRAYISNLQQLPNEYINRFVKIELVRYFSNEQIEEFLCKIKNMLNGFSENIFLWKDYECRELLRVITDDQELSKSVYEPLLRTIFDYISSMTDSYATTQRIELY